MDDTHMRFVEKVAEDMELTKELLQILYNRNAKNLNIYDKSAKMRDLITSYAMDQPGNLALIDIIAEKIKKIYDLAITEEERLCEPNQDNYKLAV